MTSSANTTSVATCQAWVSRRPMAFMWQREPVLADRPSPPQRPSQPRWNDNNTSMTSKSRSRNGNNNNDLNIVYSNNNNNNSSYYEFNRNKNSTSATTKLLKPTIAWPVLTGEATANPSSTSFVQSNERKHKNIDNDNCNYAKSGLSNCSNHNTTVTAITTTATTNYDHIDRDNVLLSFRSALRLCLTASQVTDSKLKTSRFFS